MSSRFKVPAKADLSTCNSPYETPPSTCYDHQDMTTIVVTDADIDKEYKIFRTLLMWHSSYFAAALEPNSVLAPSGGKALKLECSHEVFDAFYCWLYIGKLKDSVVESTECNDIYLSGFLLCKIWVFADCRGIPELGNRAIDMLHERCVAAWQTPGRIAYIYENTTVGSKLRDYLIQFHGSTRTFGSLQEGSVNQTVDFLHDMVPLVASRMAEGPLGRDAVTRWDRCQWHDHSGPGGKLRLEGRK
ncbi:hypothetical protein C7974DRAFT_113256 [Boeremia exigua]|uniref:uncharacterized protein n=1 Tax=Boeremia exigua TaxID=749465 RepID=UPI001E8E4B60|nr:uncharacterized protein C7974DRAFT_113256 [Boeremia exigua]KAH6642957.1 hypothetical protein C7974DRAFT_113256 [Boeremia exigua]